jgi:alpha-mannosidase
MDAPASLLEWSNPVLVPSAVKLSEDGRALIARFWNPSTDAQHCSLDTHFEHSGIRSARLDETVLSSKQIDSSDISIPPLGIVTVRLDLPHSNGSSSSAERI